jgi:hypothetical protein
MVPKPKAPTHVVETLDVPAPGGEDAAKVTCHCAVCSERGIAAIVRKAYADEHDLDGQTEDASTHVHHLVLMANSPLANAPQMRVNGPWVA